MLSGELRHSRVAELLRQCVLPLVPLKLAASYDFSSLETAIRQADELISDADELAGKVAAKESAFAAVRRLLTQLSKGAEPSRKFRRLVIALSETLCGIEEIGLRLRWPPGKRDDFFNAVVWQSDERIDELLEEFCEDAADDDSSGAFDQ